MKHRPSSLILGLLLSCSLSAAANAQSLYASFFAATDDERKAQMEAGDGETVASAIAAALDHNPQIGLADAEKQAARAGRFRALGQFLPSVEGSARYTHEDLRSSSLDTLEDRDGLTLGLTVRQPVFRGLSTLNGFREQRSRVRAAEHLVADSRTRVALLAAQAHAGVILAREIVGHRRDNLALITQQLEITRARMEAGAQSRTGVEQARMRVAQADVALQSAIARQSAEEAAYAAIVGRTPMKLKGGGDEFKLNDVASLTEALNDAYYNNPSLNAARETVSATNFAKRAAYGEFSPNLDLEGNFFRRYNQELGGSGEDEYQIVARMRIPIFAQGQNFAGVRAAASEVAREEAQLTATRLTVNEVVSRTWAEITAAEAQSQAARKAIDAAELSVTGLKMEFEAGRRTVIDVLDGQRDLVDTKISLSQAEFDLRVAQYELATVLGRIAALADAPE